LHLAKFRQGARAPENVYIVYPAQKTTKQCAKFDGAKFDGLMQSLMPAVSDVGAVTKARRENPLKFAGVPQTGKPISAVKAHSHCAR